MLDLYPAFVDGSGTQVPGYRVWRDRLVPFLQQVRSLAASSTLGQTEPLGSPTQPTVSVGRIERLDNFPSRFVQARAIDVWLSPQKGQRFGSAVLALFMNVYFVHRVLVRPS